MSELDDHRNLGIKTIKHELQNIIQGNGDKEHEDIIQTISCHLRRSKATGVRSEKNEYTKEQETTLLISFIDSNKLCYKSEFSENNKIGEGAEQKDYYYPESAKVIKINDSIYFAWWEDYFNNLQLHNYFFSATKYKLSGFKQINNILYAVVEQAFIKTTYPIDLNDVKHFLLQNGFKNTRNTDYYNDLLGIILEDLHDENVINSCGALLFIDTVFYLTAQFYAK